MLKKVKRGLNVIILFFLCTVNAQNQTEVCEVFCRVLATNSDIPVYYATIKVSGTNRGVIADSEGEFRLPCDLIASDKIVLSSIGFKTKEVAIKELRAGKVNIIYLEPVIVDLDAVNLVAKKKKERKLPAKLIVLKALNNIPLNYPKTPYSYIGYYRDYQQPIGNSYQHISTNHNKSAQYINLNEGLIEVFDAGFGTDYLTNDQNQALIYSYNKNATFLQDSALSIPYDNVNKKYLETVFIPPFGGNEFHVLNITNAIRNHNSSSLSFIDVLDKNFINNHFFSLKGIVYLNDTSIYEIDIITNSTASGNEHFAKGKIFVAKENFAIHKLQYETYRQRKKTPLYGVTIEYMPIDQKMYLNYITFNNKFEAGSDQYFKIKTMDLNTDEMFFDVYFNTKLDKNSIYPIHKKFKATYTYKNEKVKIKKVQPLKDRLRVVIDKEQLFSLPGFKLDNLKEVLRLKIKNVKDTDGRVLNDIPKVELNQYREVFVQEVFPGKQVEKGVKLMNKNAPLSTSAINDFEEIHKYWVNTPLKKNKKILK